LWTLRANLVACPWINLLGISVVLKFASLANAAICGYASQFGARI
jgi:hypothetical protein